ncbi:response regulator transcription factor, partial [Pseudanabaenaceae cyanobacterium LEGE 13415]|nr:response regulator transcription factor [Pseudanabaenaceae cyanobacterium LEGE 13415]
GRLVYGDGFVSLDASVPMVDSLSELKRMCDRMFPNALQVQPSVDRHVIQILLKVSMIESSVLSEREIEILRLLTQGFRDRDIADQLIISESTVKFHLNNVMNKLKARTRYQAIYAAIVQGWI